MALSKKKIWIRAKLVSHFERPNRRERREEEKREEEEEEEKKKRREKEREIKKVWKLTLSMDSSMDHMDFAWNCMDHMDFLYRYMFVGCGL